jgi:hypothetical protein
MIQIDVLQKDLKKVLQVLPEGVMIYKRFGNPHIKLYNNELEKLFKFKILPSKVTKSKSQEGLQENNVKSIDELD